MNHYARLDLTGEILYYCATPPRRRSSVVEQRFCKPSVIGSNPIAGSTYSDSLIAVLVAFPYIYMPQKSIARMKCTNCGETNYNTTRNPKLKVRLEMNKFCKHCKGHQVHKETK